LLSAKPVRQTLAAHLIAQQASRLIAMEASVTATTTTNVTMMQTVPALTMRRHPVTVITAIVTMTTATAIITCNHQYKHNHTLLVSSLFLCQQ
jgi:hypothetical protein